MLNENHRRLAADVSLGGVDKPTMRMIATLMTPLKIPGRWLTFRRYISRWWPNKNLIINKWRKHRRTPKRNISISVTEVFLGIKNRY